MAAYEVEAGQVGAYEKVLVAKAVDTVTFAQAVAAVEIVGDGSASIYVSVDGSEPAAKNAACYMLPALPAVRVIDLGGSGGLTRTVKLVSEGTPTYSVAAAFVS
jgi:hypothetical protein